MKELTVGKNNVINASVGIKTATSRVVMSENGKRGLPQKEKVMNFSFMTSLADALDINQFNPDRDNVKKSEKKKSRKTKIYEICTNIDQKIYYLRI